MPARDAAPARRAFPVRFRRPSAPRLAASRATGLLLCVGLLGCAQTVDGIPPAPQALAPVAGMAPELPPYRLQVGDVLSVRLLLNPDLDEDVTVRPDGRISTTLAEAVPAYGRTPEELSAELRRVYGRELRAPRLTVEVKSFAPTRIYVAGEVNAPGEFVTVGPDLTAVQAVARAGGVKLSADSDRLFILRRGPGDVPQVLAVDYRAAITGSDPRADVRLAPFDVLYVPRTGIYQVFTHFNQYLQQFVPVSWGFSYLVNPVVSNNSSGR